MCKNVDLNKFVHNHTVFTQDFTFFFLLILANHLTYTLINSLGVVLISYKHFSFFNIKNYKSVCIKKNNKKTIIIKNK